MKVCAQFIVFLCLCILSVDVLARDIKKVHGEDTYVVPETVTLAEGKRTAIERAKINALSKKFGTIVTQAQGSIVENRSGKSFASFMSVGETLTKGEWLETIGEPELEVQYKNDLLSVTAKVVGRARELKTAKVDFKARLLGRGDVEKVEYEDGEDFFLSFESPVDGYLAVFLIDEHHNANRLFPYQAAEGKGVKMTHGEKYTLFKGDEDDQITDRIVMKANAEVEQNIVYIVFSPKPFSLASGFSNKEKIGDGKLKDYELPSKISYREFVTWINKCRILDEEMRVDIQNISIRRE